MSPSGGLERYANLVHPEVVEEILAWRDHPELRKLLAGLTAHTRRKAFLNTYAEAVIARHLLRAGCELHFEVSTPTGKACDFCIGVDGVEFFLHIKRVNTGRPVRKKLTVSSRLRYLERISRPYVVSVRWREGARDEEMQRLVKTAADFILRASVGDELTIQDDAGRELGGVRIVAPWGGSHVTLAIGLPSGFIDEGLRIRKLMRKAYQQFMPKALNVIMICTSHADDADDFESALLGAHIERWDTHPPRGRRIAHGRDEDGFWSGRRYEDSQVAGWFRIGAEISTPPCRLWYRDSARLGSSERAALERLFDGPAGSRPTGV